MSGEPEGTITWSRGDRSETLPWNASGAEMHAAYTRVMFGDDAPQPDPEP